MRNRETEKKAARGATSHIRGENEDKATKVKSVRAAGQKKIQEILIICECRTYCQYVLHSQISMHLMQFLSLHWIQFSYKKILSTFRPPVLFSLMIFGKTALLSLCASAGVSDIVVDLLPFTALQACSSYVWPPQANHSNLGVCHVPRLSTIATTPTGAVEFQLYS